MTDEPREQEIAPCPMRGCGGECRKQHTLGTLSIWWVECRKCDYQSRVCDTEVEAIAAHNALCADVKRGRDAAKIEWSLRYLIQAAQAVVQNVWPVLTSNGITLSVSAIVDLREAIGRGRAALDTEQGEAPKP
jgi:hypothetical protein